MTDPTVSQRSKKARLGVVFGVTNSLGALVNLYGGTDKGAHGYLPHYERHLGPRRLRRQTVYEIGVGGHESPTPGGSLPVWRDYFPRSVIVGLDIAPKNIDFGRNVRFEQADQSSAVDLARVVERHGAPDVVIDDGSHVAEHIQASFEFLWPLLPAGGIYVIEDLSTSYYPDYGGGDPAPDTSALGLLRSLTDDVQALDLVFKHRPELGTRGPARHADVAAVHTYPGIAFIEKH